MEQFAATIPVWFGVCNGTFKGCFFRLYHKDVKSLLGDIQQNLDNRRVYSILWYSSYSNFKEILELSKGRPEKRYKSADNTNDFLVNGFRTVMGICGWASIIGSAAYALYHYLRGTLTEDKIKTAVPSLYVCIFCPLIQFNLICLWIWIRLPYDLTNFPAYLITSICYAIAVNFWIFSIAATDTFFMSLCVSFDGCFKDLMDMYEDIDVKVR